MIKCALDKFQKSIHHPPMLEAVEKLLALQDRDQRIKNFRNELTSLPAEKKSKEQLIADAATRLETAKTRAKEIEVEKKTLEVEAQAKRDTISKYKNQQLQTRKNEEFTALAHEIAASEKIITEIEDRELVLMEEAEALRPKIQEAETAYTTDKSKYEDQITALATKKGNLESRIAALEAERGGLTDGIDEDLLDQYNRLFQTKNGAAVVALEHEVCTGCHMKVTTQTVIAAKSEKEIIQCPQCARILFIIL